MTFLNKGYAIAFFSFVCFFSFAQQAICADELATVKLPTLEVSAERIAPTTGTVIIDKEMIENLPSRNGSVNEIIGIAPGIQYGEDYLNSFTGGEVEPPGVSISGSRFYENNYTIDGLSNNNPVDPGNGDYVDSNKLPAHPQIHFLSKELIEEIKVYNSNIPAEFGGFIGGQVDVKTINPSSDFWGSVNYRTTRSSWTEFHISDEDKEDFYHSEDNDYQPKFTKHDGGLIINTPVGPDTSFITAYQQKKSFIPLRQLGQTETQTRKHESFFFKLGHDFSLTNRISATALYSPVEGKYFLNNFKNGDYTLNRDSYSFVINSENYMDSGLLTFAIGYNGQKSERKGGSDRFFWDTSTTSIDWESGFEGSLGPLKTGFDEINANADFEFKNLKFKQTDHKIKLGTEISYSDRYYNRPETYYYYFVDVVAPITCQPDDNACIENEQYLKYRTKYFKGESSSHLFNFATYIQDAIAWKRLEIFPGLRMSYDSIAKKGNLAPRFSAALDVFGNHKTTIYVGKNRYYSGTPHTYELYTSLYYEVEKRSSQNDPWVGTDNYTRQSSDLKTPYSDETSIGIIQKIFGGELKVQYIEKKNKDEITRSKDSDLKTYTLNNNGTSEHENWQVSWHRYWRNHSLELNCTWQETRSNHTDYESTLNDDDLTDTIWYEGKEIGIDEFIRADYNRPFVANLIYSGKLPHGITFTNISKYRGPYTWREYQGYSLPSSIDPTQMVRVYKRAQQKRALTFDWKFSWAVPTSSKQQAILSLDIYNVFNKKSKYGAGIDNYEIGRQFWAGLTYKF
ncbi:Outer membrane receptor proteins, mostly Fe transport [Malonomonas rubra DSM 5091]|uniref:Outer membrane receptor proteins, mostly Fe transport n=1 Tax=Malonomonas rubra DSM 5091 TaxID=1122189 RepID=A0A1M6BFZ5_MALRU|nr:TonB-dependent receptor plug domain-containing protein [Malonomonas rubra]SHI47642.1 Outer membrane receptor proteins, mostly Fe transport [Malonomonas rubra DSM 5091]